jgi:acyl dehydratase
MEVEMSELRDLIGKELEPSEWLEITQERIDAFADATDDHQWIHVDPARAAEGPFGTTIAHGFLTLSLCAPLLSKALAALVTSGMSINYGTNKVRFPAPVPVGSKVRASVTLKGVEEVTGGLQCTLGVTIEREGGDKPVCIAEWVFRQYAG